jgi:hypothetical protein
MCVKNQTCVACKLTPLTGGPLKFCEVGHANARETGGLKGEMAPGNAHPFLAPFHLVFYCCIVICGRTY